MRSKACSNRAKKDYAARAGGSQTSMQLLGDLAAFFRAGGPVMVLLGLLSLAIVAIILYCLREFKAIRSGRHPLAERMQRLMEEREFDPISAFRIAAYDLRRALQWLLYLAHIATLSGLLGTVLGIQQAFQRLAGAREAMLEIIAGGIHQAVSTTIVGLCLAIPALLFHYMFRDWYRRLELDPPEARRDL